MGIFVNTLGIGSYEEGSRHASLDPTIELSLQNVLESEMNWSATMQAIYLDELAYKAHTGEEKVYSLNEATGIFESIKNFFKKLWDKIKALFERFIAMFNSFAKSDSAFVNKYAKTLRKLTFKDLRCNVYKFTHLDKGLDEVKKDLGNAKPPYKGPIDDILESLFENKPNSFINDTVKKEDVDEFCKIMEKNKSCDSIRGASVGKESVSSQNYNDQLFKYFRDGKLEPKETKITSITEYLKEIENTSDAKEKAKDSYDEFKDMLENVIDTLDTVEDKLSEIEGEQANLKLRAVTKASNYFRSYISILEIWNGAQLKAIKDRNRQAKSVCVKALANGRKNEISTKYESSDIFGDDTDGSFLSRVELI